MAVFQEDLGGILNANEQAAVAIATDLYSAQAKIGAAEFISTLGLSPDVQSGVIIALGEQISRITDFRELKEIGSHFEDLYKVLGRTATGQITTELVPEAATETPVISLVPAVEEVKTEKSRAVNTNDVDSDHSLAPEVMPHDPAKLSRSQKKFLTKVFGEDSLGIIENFTQEQRNELLDKLLSHYENLKIMRLTPSGRRDRSEQVRMIFEGKSHQEIADKFGVTRGSIVQGLDKATHSITSRTDETVLAVMLGGVPSSIGTKEVTDQNPVKAQTVDTETISVEKLDGSLVSSLLLIAETLNINSKTGQAALKEIFDEQARSAWRGSENDSLRQDIATLIDQVQQDSLVKPELILDDLEVKALELVTGTAPNIQVPITVINTKGRLSKDLQAAHRKLEDVLAAALYKIHTARKSVNIIK